MILAELERAADRVDMFGAVALRPVPWREPADVGAAFADEAYAAVLRSDAQGWSYVLRDPEMAKVLRVGDAADLADLPDGFIGRHNIDPRGPPFQGGLLGLAAYELSARLEATAPQARCGRWPDLALLGYSALLAFHQDSRRAFAVGRGRDADAAERQAARAADWAGANLVAPAAGRLAADFELVVSDRAHAAAAADALTRIAAGEMFQANLARPWRGRLVGGAQPYDLFHRLSVASPAAYAAYLRLPGLALVSNSPERFLSVRPDSQRVVVRTDPIKGTRPRGADPASDAANAEDLLTSAKDRAENLMIVDLMRNDLARVCRPGSVRVVELAALKSYANVHHLVSRVEAELSPGKGAWDAFLAAFPPGSVTGAPKLQAMKVIAGHEAPRGPYCGSLFWLGHDGAMDASVLIRTAAFAEDQGGWRFEARAGGGIVADSDPDAEVAETTAKISAIRAALEADA